MLRPYKGVAVVVFAADCGQVGSGSGGAIGIWRFIVDDCEDQRVGPALILEKERPCDSKRAI